MRLRLFARLMILFQFLTMASCIPLDLVDLERQDFPASPTPSPTPGPTLEPDMDSDGVSSSGGDCDDSDATIYPGADELCDALDNDCDGSVDEGDALLAYLDQDGDAFGSSTVLVPFCSTVPDNAVPIGGDCNDANHLTYPGASEVCDGADNDCDGNTDEGILIAYYPDEDRDLFGDDSRSILSCSGSPVGYIGRGGDCDDSDPMTFPGAEELCDGKDNDCDATVDEGLQTEYYRDADVDAYGAPESVLRSCKLPSGYVSNALDCDDARPDINPAAPELCDGVDNDCSGVTDDGLPYDSYYPDNDEDGFGVDQPDPLVACVAQEGFSVESGDCDDRKSDVYPGAAEICDDIDNNCDGAVDEPVDADGDSFLACDESQPILSDCDDDSPTRYPGAADAALDSIDSNCNGAIDRVETMAGNGLEGGGGDGGPAISASLRNPAEIELDADGSLYITDTGNHRIRKVTASGIITTIAGTGSVGSSGDGGPATSAQLSSPTGVAVDAEGIVYIADTGNNKVRRISLEGNISTHAGTGQVTGALGDNGPATAARLRAPSGLDLYPDGTLFIADTLSCRVRRVSTSGTITTVAGNGDCGFSGDGSSAVDAQLNLPTSVALDGQGGFYVADSVNNRVRFVNSSGIISTYAGDGSLGSGSNVGDGGPATSASISNAICVTFDTQGRLFVADMGHNRIRMVLSDSRVIYTVAGTGTAGYSGDGGSANEAMIDSPISVTRDSAGNLWFTDQGNERVRRIKW